MADEVTAAGLRDDRNVCQLCGTLENLALCGGCHETWYCSKDHQRVDWNLHKRQCRANLLVRSRNSGLGQELCGSGSESARSADRTLHTQTTSESDSCSKSERDSPAASQTSVLHGQKRVKRHKKNTCSVGAIGRQIAEQLPVIIEEGSDQRYFLDTSLFSQEMRAKHTRHSRRRTMPPRGPITDSNRLAYLNILNAHLSTKGDYAAKSLKQHGLCVIDRFLGEENGEHVFKEVRRLRDTGHMRPGQLVDSGANFSTKIRGDITAWSNGREQDLENLTYLVQCMNLVVMRCASQFDNLTVNERTKAMIACYPGRSSGYVQHVDNPNQDGRCITCIYYLNKHWDCREHGGNLRIYPEDRPEDMADISPDFDRLVLFWSDRRNPHEVLPSCRDRYAITVWYYEAEERASALERKMKGVESSPSKTQPQAVPLFNGSESHSSDSDS